MLIDGVRTITELLAEWRAAERDLEQAAEGSPEYDVLAARVHDMARAYREATDTGADGAALAGREALPATGNA